MSAISFDKYIIQFDTTWYMTWLLNPKHAIKGLPLGEYDLSSKLPVRMSFTGKSSAREAKTEGTEGERDLPGLFHPSLINGKCLDLGFPAPILVLVLILDRDPSCRLRVRLRRSTSHHRLRNSRRRFRGFRPWFEHSINSRGSGSQSLMRMTG